jgi:hypothetical protein
MRAAIRSTVNRTYPNTTPYQAPSGVEPHFEFKPSGKARAVLILSSLWLLIGGPLAVRPAVGLSELLVGVSGGICGGLFGVSSVFPATWLSARGLDKIRQRAIIQPYIIVAQCISLIMLCFRDALTTTVVQAIALYFVPLLAGLAVGAAGFRIVSSGMYTRSVLAITFLSGLTLLFH